MKERPLIFTGESVRAILAGTKIQTRRLLKLPPTERAILRIVPAVGSDGSLWDAEGDDDKGLVWHSIACPYGVAGDYLWVREPWRTRLDQDHIAPRDLDPRWTHPTWIADYPDITPSGCGGGVGRLRPARFLPRAFSRISLELTDVRVQRLRDIGASDIAAEGVSVEHGHQESHTGEACSDCALAFADRWDSINAKRGYSWDSNPWVWALTFRRLP